jgi:hypothetical protein
MQHYYGDKGKYQFLNSMMKAKRKIDYDKSIEQLRQKLDVKQITEGITLNNGQLDHLLKVLEINYVPILPQDELKVEKVKENIIELKKSGERLQKEIDEYLIVGHKILNALEKEKESEDDNIINRLQSYDSNDLDHQVDELNERGENLRKSSIKLNDAYFTLHRVIQFLIQYNM